MFRHRDLPGAQPGEIVVRRPVPLPDQEVAVLRSEGVGPEGGCERTRYPRVGAPIRGIQVDQLALVWKVGGKVAPLGFRGELDPHLPGDPGPSDRCPIETVGGVQDSGIRREPGRHIRLDNRRLRCREPQQPVDLCVICSRSEHETHLHCFCCVPAGLGSPQIPNLVVGRARAGPQYDCLLQRSALALPPPHDAGCLASRHLTHEQPHPSRG